MSSRTALRHVMLLLPALVAGPALAILPHTPEQLGPDGASQLQPLVRVLQAAGDESFSAGRAASDPAWQSFLEEHGERWTVRYDRRTDRLAFAQGEGVPFLPGAGNDLSWKALGLDEAPAGDALAGVLSGRVREFVQAQAGLFRVPAGVDLVILENGIVKIPGRDIWGVTLRAEVNGMTVPGAFLTFRVHSGNLVQFGAARISDALGTAPTEPVLSAEDALSDALGSLSLAFAPAAKPGSTAPAPAVLEDVLDRGTLVLLPVAQDRLSYVGEPGLGLEYRLSWRLSFTVEGGLVERWVSHRDAVTGEQLSLFDETLYACPQPASPQGRVTGGVWIGAIEEVSESVRGFQFTAVENGGPLTTDINGIFPLDTAAPSSTGLNGQFFDMNCSGCSNPAQANVESAFSGTLALGNGGLDETGNGNSTRAERNCFYHLNVVRQLGSKHVDDASTNGFLNRTMPANVNIAATCNASFGGGQVNFFRSGGGCNNTGEIADVMQHEWGHGIDVFTNQSGDFDGGRSEGLGDVLAFLSTHDPRLGPYFRVGQAGGIRNADENVVDLKTRLNVIDNPGGADLCPAGGGVFGAQVHCEGGIFSQTNWHLARILRDKYGETGGWYTAERLVFQAMLFSDTHAPNEADSAYDAYILVDDENGDLADGTPNAEQINDAFSHHEIASAPLALDSAECVPPDAPVLGLELLNDPATERPQIRISWNDVPATVQYEIYRNEAGGVGSDLPLAIVTPPFAPINEFFDDSVVEGVEYFYRISTFDMAGCVSLDDNRESITTVPVASFAVDGFSVGDFGPMANANGIPEPGETIDLDVALRLVSGTATGVVATLSTMTPGVTVLSGPLAYPDMTVGGAPGITPDVYVIEIDASVPCTELLVFVLEIEANEGCTREQIVLQAGVIDNVPVVFDDMEIDAGWQVDPDGTDDATAGIWELGAPNGTAAQPGADHTPGAGVLAWVTGNTPGGGAGADDVDDGCTTLQSPVMDVGGQAGLVLRYWRHFQIQTTLDDSLDVTISNDGGTNWLPVESLTVSTGGFQEAVFDLDGLLGEPADQVVLRLNICDTGGGSLLEAALDDLAIVDPQAVCLAPLPRPLLTALGSAVLDTRMDGGSGNGNGVAEPGEQVRVALDLENLANGVALNTVAVATLVGAPPGVVLVDDTTSWAPIAAGAQERSGLDDEPHFGLFIPASLECAGQVSLEVVVSYEGETAPTSVLMTMVSLDIGLPGGPVTNVPFSTFFEMGEGAWTHGADAGADEWELGTPANGGGGDPDAAYSGDNVWATDLDNRYEHNASTWLEAPSVDCSGLDNMRLSFRRWLNVEEGQYDQAVIEVNGTEIWRNPFAGDLRDNSWVEVEYDISAIADDNPDVRVRFSLTSDGGRRLGGWNIDDFSIHRRINDCAECDAGVVPADVGTVLYATGRKDVGAEFTWPDAMPQDTEHFRLYRGTSPDLLDELVTPGGHGLTTYHDQAATGSLYYYRLRIGDCSGAEGP